MAQGGNLSDRLLAELTDRIRRYDESGDQAVLLDTVLQEQVHRLYDQLARERTDVAAMVTLIEWSKRRIEQFGRNRGETQIVRMLTTLVQQLDPKALITDVQPILAPQDENAMAMTLVEHFEHHGDISALSRAKVLLTQALRTAAADESELATILSSIATVTAHEFVVGDKLTDVEAAVSAAQDAVRRMPRDNPLWLGQVVVLTWVLALRHERTGDMADLQEAIRIGRVGIDQAPRGSTDLPYALANLGAALVKRFDRLGAVSDLDEGIEFVRAAIRLTPENHPGRMLNLSALSFSLMRRFMRVRDLRDGHEAVQVATAVLAGAPSRGPLASALLGNSALVLAQRFGITGSLADIDEAVELSRRGCEAAQNVERRRFWALSNHAVILLMRYAVSDAEQHADEAADAARAAIAAVKPDDPLHTIATSNLVLILSVRTDPPADTSNVDEAVKLGRGVLARLSPGNPARARALTIQATALLRRHDLTKSAEDLDEAVGLLRSATNIRSGAPEQRMEAAKSWHRAAMKANQIPMATEAAAAAVQLLPILAWRGHDWATREQRLTGVSGVGSNAAALALATGKPELAVELLEQGRSVLWSQALQTRTDLTNLRDVAPDLADMLDQARTALDAGESADPSRRRQAEQWDTLVSEVRRLPGFGSFLATVPFDQLSQAATAGPVVIVNPSPMGSNALIVRPGNVRVIPLPWLDFRAATQRTQVLLKAQQEAEANRGPVTRAHLRQTTTSILRWLWDTVAEPILSTIDTDRVHWCPTGPLTFLPLHAAGRHQTGRRSAGRTVPDRVVSSYTTTLTALLRSSAARPGTPRLLAVGMPETPGYVPLPAVHEELARITATVPGSSTLVGSAATEAAVLAELDRHSWVHFACHGTQNADQPAASAIHLHDAPLTVMKLATRGLPNAELAYLSACHTATGSTQLADEAIHLTAALQSAGYRHVIGTQWSITDEHAADVASAVYRELAHHDPATALSRAVAPLRAAYPDRPELWAPYMHTGP